MASTSRKVASATGEQHAADNLAIFKAIKRKSQLPIWLVGTAWARFRLRRPRFRIAMASLRVSC